ncbi:type II secretion system protein [bacterium]|nr:type II secretion system protein [bacterium]
MLEYKIKEGRNLKEDNMIKNSSRVDFSLPEKLDCQFAGRRKTAFTLAEVLITLGIIGIVAAMTLPNLIFSYQEKQTVSKLKKIYSALSQGYNLYIQENGGPFVAESQAAAAASDCQELRNLITIMKKSFKKVHDCNSSYAVSCYSRNYYKTLTGNDYTYGYDEGAAKGKFSFMTMDGMTVGFNWDGSYNQNLIIVDLNGPAKPNRGGYDAFAFYINGYKIMPMDVNYGSRHLNFCKPTDDNTGYGALMNGWGCSWYVLTNENLDYQKCVKGQSKYCDKEYIND